MKKTQMKLIVSLFFFLLGILFSHFSWNVLFFFLSYFVVGWEVLKTALQNLLQKEWFDENFLMTVATIGAFAIGEYPEAAAIMLFYRLGEFFQDLAVSKSKKSIRSLMKLKPDKAVLWEGEQMREVAPEEVEVGDILLVKPGEKVPLDGKIVEGNTSFNTVNLTGESLPLEANVGDTVLSGVINLENVVKIRVTKPYQESTVQKILELVEHANSKKSTSETFIRKFSRYYTPIVVVSAFLLALLPPILLHQPFSPWIYRALCFLVVSCPCALVISIPLSFFGGIGAASRIGVLVKGSSALENLKEVKTVVFDKTGTLTEGVFEVQKIIPQEISKEELLKVAAYAEVFSNHPIAKSLKKAYGKEIDEKYVKELKQYQGMGLKVLVDGKVVLVGNAKLLEEHHIAFEEIEEVGTLLYVAIDEEYRGSIVISDRVKPDALEAIHSLRRLGIEHIVVLTGDKQRITASVCKELGIGTYYAELLPNDKVAKVEELRRKKSANEKILFVGDGMNDAPVLALADIGIAMGAIGSDAALESSDIVIMTDEPSKVAKVMKLSKKTLTIVRENIVFALTVKILILVASAFGITTMWFSVFGDVGVTLLAVCNALRTMRIK